MKGTHNDGATSRSSASEERMQQQTLVATSGDGMRRGQTDGNGSSGEHTGDRAGAERSTRAEAGEPRAPRERSRAAERFGWKSRRR